MSFLNILNRRVVTASFYLTLILSMLIFRAVLHFLTSLIKALIVLTLIQSVFAKFLKLSELTCLVSFK